MSATIRVTFGVVSFIVVQVCAIASTVTQTRMVAEVNAQLPAEARFAACLVRSGTTLTTTDTSLNATPQLLHELNERKPLVLVKPNDFIV